jgi:hypothetical protein
MRRGAVGQENPGELGNPVGRSAAAPKGGFEAAVEALEDAVGLRVECSGGNVGDIEESGKVGPKGGNKLGSTV